MEVGKELHQKAESLYQSLKDVIGKVADTSKQEEYLRLSLKNLMKATKKISKKIRQLNHLKHKPEVTIARLSQEEDFSTKPVEKLCKESKLVNEVARLYLKYIRVDDEEGLSIYWQQIIRSPEAAQEIKKMLEATKDKSDERKDVYTLDQVILMGKTMMESLKKQVENGKDLAQTHMLPEKYEKIFVDLDRNQDELEKKLKEFEEYKQKYTKNSEEIEEKEPEDVEQLIEELAKLGGEADLIGKFVNVKGGKLEIDWQKLVQSVELKNKINKVNEMNKNGPESGDSAKIMSVVEEVVKEVKSLRGEYEALMTNMVKAKQNESRINGILIQVVQDKLEKKTEEINEYKELSGMA